jgi:carbonic anhydrase
MPFREQDGLAMTESDLSRRKFLERAGTVAAGAALGSTAALESAEAKKKGKKPRRPGRRFPHPATPDAALALLLKGNKRFQKGRLQLRDYSPVGEDRSHDQKPFAAIITCADSRLSPSLVFDIHLGNIFVSRIAGNSIDAFTLGSTEYAVKVLGAKVVMVLGHSDCGAIKAAIGVANGTASYPPDKYGQIGEFIKPLLPPILTLPPDQRTLLSSTTVNARAQAATCAGRDPIIRPAVAAGTLKVVSAVYDIKTGAVNLV